ncbi:MAG: hypothetical protein ACJAUP_000785 [Cellvibrionaceae bacterium]|jgi:hypothetical protein
MRFTVIAYNIMRIFEEKYKVKNPERMHPSDKKHNESLEKNRILPETKAASLTHYFFILELRAYAHSPLAPYRCNNDRKVGYGHYS